MTPSSRFTLRDLPLPAKLVLSTFLMTVGLGYLWAMAQIHFKHASAGEPMPTQADLVARFSGAPWPLVPKPDPAEAAEKKDAADKARDGQGVFVDGVKIKTIVTNRCAVCHNKDGEKDDIPLTTHDELAKYLKQTTDYPKGQLHMVVTGDPTRWGKKAMVKAFFEKAKDWDDSKPAEMKASKPGREAERLVVVAWIEAGAPKSSFDADAFPLPPGFSVKDLPETLKAPAAPLVAADKSPKKEADPWKEAKQKQLSVDGLTQSTHAHLLSFAVLWTLTGLTFAFTRYPGFVRGFVGPIVLVAQVLDISCWWLARLDAPVGPYFALCIMATGGIVGLGLGAQITLSLLDMYGKKGKAVIILLFLTGATLFGLVFVKVIEPQLQAEKALVVNRN